MVGRGMKLGKREREKKKKDDLNIKEC